MREDIVINAINGGSLHWNGGGTHYPIQSSVDGRYFTLLADTGSDLKITSSATDRGLSWFAPSAVFVGTIVAFACWYRRWSGINSDVIDIAYTESGGSDILYRSYNIATGTFGTETTVFNGVSTAVNGALSIVTGRDGTIRIAGSIDNGLEDGAWSSTDNGATWADTIADPSEGGSGDQYFLLPGWNADTADVMLIFVDASANGLSVKRYDDSGNAWTEAAIIADGSFTDFAAGTAFPNVACAVDLANSRNIVVAWSAVDTLNADLRCFIVTDTTITEVTNVVQNSVNNQGLCAIGIDTDTGDWYVFYGGKSDGSDTWNSSLAIYYKKSTDSGTTWSSETAINWDTYAMGWLACTPRFATDFMVEFSSDQVVDLLIASIDVPTGGGGGNANLLAGKL